MVDVAMQLSLRQVAAVVDPSEWGSICIQGGASVRVSLVRDALGAQGLRRTWSPSARADQISVGRSEESLARASIGDFEVRGGGG